MFGHGVLKKSETTRLTDDEIKGLQDVGVEYAQGEVMEIGRIRIKADPGRFHRNVFITPKFDRIADEEHQETMRIYREKRPLFRKIG